VNGDTLTVESGQQVINEVEKLLGKRKALTAKPSGNNQILSINAERERELSQKIKGGKLEQRIKQKVFKSRGNRRGELE